MKKLSVKEVSDCHNAPMSVRGDVTKYFVCGTCHRPCDQSVVKPKFGKDFWYGKVNPPVESVSQPKAVDGFDEHMRQGFHDHAIKFPEAENTQFESGFDVAQELAEKYLRQELAQAREERDKEIHEVILDILFSLDRDQSREYQRGVKVATSTIEMIVNKDLLASAERE